MYFLLPFNPGPSFAAFFEGRSRSLDLHLLAWNVAERVEGGFEASDGQLIEFETDRQEPENIVKFELIESDPVAGPVETI